MKHGNYSFFIPHLGCPHRCSFCDQNTIADVKAPPTPNEVALELKSAVEHHAVRENTEIAFFGGSFTALPQELMREYLSAAAPFVGEGKFSGIRLSTRPDALSEGTVSLLTQFPVTAVEIGAQSMDDAVLLQNGRGHTAQDVVDSATRVKAAGLSLGLQMMTGLYGDTFDSTIATAKRLIALAPDTVRIYPTVVLPNTRLAELYLSGAYHPPGIDETIPLCVELLELFESANIRVIRLGLHAEPNIEQTMLAGCYHPALRELCTSEQLYRKALQKLQNQPERDIIIEVAPADVSAMIGQKKQNIGKFAERGFTVRVAANPTLSRGDIHLKRKEEHTCV